MPTDPSEFFKSLMEAARKAIEAWDMANNVPTTVKPDYSALNHALYELSKIVK